MKNLLILRHAEAAGKASGGTDFERQLTDAGKDQARAQGVLLRTAQVGFDRIVASSALRAVQTAGAVKEAAGFSGEVEAVEALYNAPGEVLLEFVRGLPNEFSTVLMVAHLPGVAQLLSLLTTEHVDLEQIFSPGTMAGVQAEGDSWEDLDYGVGALTLFIPPIIPFV